MNPLLQRKLESLQKSEKFECWYLVKHSTNFSHLCYLVSILKDYIELGSSGDNLETFIANKVSVLNDAKPDLQLSSNYRALRVAAFFGLIKMMSSGYGDVEFTDTYNEITSRCNGEYEHVTLYQDIITRQIEKIYVSSIIDEGRETVRKDYTIFPIMFLNKVLVEIGKVSGSYSISMIEYKYLVATTKKFKDYLETMLYIKLLREDPNAAREFELMRDKFDNRMNKAIELVDYLEVSNGRIAIKDSRVDEVSKKVFEFESNNYEMSDNEYINFLCSTKSMFDDEQDNNKKSEETNCVINESIRLKGGFNAILYGVPGSGKSWTIKNDYCDDENRMERLVFHPDYTYSDFVGQILPKLDENGNVTYLFTPGPFTKLLRTAYKNPTNMYYLIIEEVNRGNAPAIFGDIFQLLDRDENGSSDYKITNADIAKIVYNDESHKVIIPSNMSIVCTMNTSDQNVFTLDTAFQRRWSMRLIKNKFHTDEENESKFSITPILDTNVTWEKFFTEINKIILDKNIKMTSSEDKRLGTHFVSKEDLHFNPTVDDKGFMTTKARLQNSKFPEKVLKYLWDDAFKFTKEDVFDTEKYKSLEDVIDKFLESKGNERFRVFKENIFNLLISTANII